MIAPLSTRPGWLRQVSGMDVGMDAAVGVGIGVDVFVDGIFVGVEIGWFDGEQAESPMRSARQLVRIYA